MTDIKKKKNNNNKSKILPDKNAVQVFSVGFRHTFEQNILEPLTHQVTDFVYHLVDMVWVIRQREIVNSNCIRMRHLESTTCGHTSHEANGRFGNGNCVYEQAVVVGFQVSEPTFLGAQQAWPRNGTFIGR